MVQIKEWLASRARIDQQLYERYGRPLEREHEGEYVAIGPEGQLILGSSDVEVLEQAIDAFGSGNFALGRVGHRTFGRWLNFLR